MTALEAYTAAVEAYWARDGEAFQRAVSTLYVVGQISDDERTDAAQMRAYRARMNEKSKRIKAKQRGEAA